MKSKTGTFCGLVRGNPKFPGILDLFREHEISRFNFLVDLKMQSTTQCQNGQTIYIEFALFKIHKISDLEMKKIF